MNIFSQATKIDFKLTKCHAQLLMAQKLVEEKKHK